MAGEPTVTVVGNVGADPELRFLPDGTPVCNLRVACTERKLINGEWQDVRTDWFKINIWKKPAEAAAEHITKGTRVVVVGRLSFDEYEKDGERRTIPEITADVVGIVPKPAAKPEKKQEDGSPW